MSIVFAIVFAALLVLECLAIIYLARRAAKAIRSARDVHAESLENIKKELASIEGVKQVEVLGRHTITVISYVGDRSDLSLKRRIYNKESELIGKHRDLNMDFVTMETVPREPKKD